MVGWLVVLRKNPKKSLTGDEKQIKSLLDPTIVQGQDKKRK